MLCLKVGVVRPFDSNESAKTVQKLNFITSKVTKSNKIKTRSEMSMEKNRIRPVKSGKGIRMSYSRQKEVLGMLILLKFRDSYEWL